MNPEIEIEMAKLLKLRDQVKLKSDIDFDPIFYTCIGMTLVNIQRVEFSMKGAIVHLKEILLKRSPDFKALNAERLFSDNPADNKYRRQTLGGIVKFLKTEVKLFNEDELDAFLSKRNTFIHGFWWQFLSYEKGKDRNEKVKALDFVIDLYGETLKWDSIFLGFIYSIAMNILALGGYEENSQRPFEHMKKHHRFFLDSVKN